MNSVIINKREIGVGRSPYIIAELSANHNGDLQKAKDSITAAHRCGADAIKLQTYTADTMTIDCDKPEFRIDGGLWDGYKLYDLYEQAHTPFKWHKKLFEHAQKLGITAFSTPFDESALELLESLEVPAYKVASFEVVDLPLIRQIAETRKPIIISTGMANEIEIAEAVSTARDAGCKQLILLHCISSYPAPIEQSNLLTIPDMRKRFGVAVGLSDHSTGNTAAIAAVALGACVIEKHFTLDRNDPGPDSLFSIEPAQLSALCRDCRDVWRALGKAGYECKSAEKDNLQFRRSLYFVTNVDAGETLTKQHVRRIRPGYGLAPKYLEEVLGKTLKTAVSYGTPVSWDVLL